MTKRKKFRFHLKISSANKRFSSCSLNLSSALAVRADKNYIHTLRLGNWIGKNIPIMAKRIKIASKSHGTDC